MLSRCVTCLYSIFGNAPHRWSLTHKLRMSLIYRCCHDQHRAAGMSLLLIGSFRFRCFEVTCLPRRVPHKLSVTCHSWRTKMLQTFMLLCFVGFLYKLGTKQLGKRGKLYVIYSLAVPESWVVSAQEPDAVQRERNTSASSETLLRLPSLPCTSGRTRHLCGP